MFQCKCCMFFVPKHYLQADFNLLGFGLWQCQEKVAHSYIPNPMCMDVGGRNGGRCHGVDDSDDVVTLIYSLTNAEANVK